LVRSFLLSFFPSIWPVVRAGICLREQVTEAVNPRATREAAIGLQFGLIGHTPRFLEIVRSFAESPDLSSISCPWYDQSDGSDET
jgi:hypothetical protein